MGVLLDVGLVAVEHFELDFLVTRAVEQVLVVIPIVWADGLWVRHAVGVLPARGLKGEELAEGIGIGG